MMIALGGLVATVGLGSAIGLLMLVGIDVREWLRRKRP